MQILILDFPRFRTKCALVNRAISTSKTTIENPKNQNSLPITILALSGYDNGKNKVNHLAKYLQK